MTTASAESPPSPPDTVERGRFTDGTQTYVVYVDNLDAPTSFQVLTERADPVLVVTDLWTEHKRATWSAGWGDRSDQWCTWLRESAFQVLHHGTAARVRHCDG